MNSWDILVTHKENKRILQLACRFQIVANISNVIFNHFDHSSVDLHLPARLWHFALALNQGVDEILGKLFITIVVEGGGQTLVVDTSGTSDTMWTLLPDS